jgi:creatinine amidohydrolase
VRVHDCNWMMIEEYLKHDDRVVVPIGSTEQHGYLSLGTDAILAERVSVEAAEPLGVPVMPALPFGLAPYFAAFPGSMTLRSGTYVALIRDMLDSLTRSGFRRIAIVNGHGGNIPAVAVVREWIAEKREDRVQVLFHSWYNAPRTAEASLRFGPAISHGSWVENFPWTLDPGRRAARGEQADHPGRRHRAVDAGGDPRAHRRRQLRRPARAARRGNAGDLAGRRGRSPGPRRERLGRQVSDQAGLAGKTALVTGAAHVLHGR